MPESIPDFDLYAALGVATDADPGTIRAAHREAVRRAHPDTTLDIEAGDEAAKQLNVARDWLTDPTRRARYDEARGFGAWTAATGVGTSETTAIRDTDDGLEARLDGREAIGCLEVAWWLLLIVAAALIFVTLLLLVAER